MSQSYAWDPTGTPALLSDGAGNEYVWGQGLVATVSNGAAVYSLNDGLGSVREGTTPVGGVSGTSDFDAFGLSLHQTGTLSPIGFTGGLTDPETGFVYLRARYYDPSTGRFQTRDPLPGVKSDPTTQNGFSYAQDNPTRWVDPTGRDDAPVDAVAEGEQPPESGCNFDSCDSSPACQAAPWDAGACSSTTPPPSSAAPACLIDCGPAPAPASSTDPSSPLVPLENANEANPGDSVEVVLEVGFGPVSATIHGNVLGGRARFVKSQVFFCPDVTCLGVVIIGGNPLLTPDAVSITSATGPASILLATARNPNAIPPTDPEDSGAPR